MILPKFSKHAYKAIREIYSSPGKTAMMRARQMLAKEDYAEIQKFRRQQAFTFMQALLHILQGWSKIPKCKNQECTNEVQFGRKGAKNEYKRYCSPKCSNTDDVTKEKAKKTCIAKFGVENASQATEIKQKKIATCLANHGVEHPSQSKKIRKKIVKAVQDRYGVDNVSQSKEVLRAKKKTWIKKYGYDNPSKAPEIKRIIGQRVHSTIARKKVVNGQGKRYILQGYEPQALKYIRKYFKYRHIHDQSSGRVPSFEYYFDGRERMYFPDFLIQTENYECIVEVKSIYTLCKTSSTYRMMKAKIKAVAAAGYQMKLLVMESCGKKIKLPQDWINLTYRQFKTLLLPNRFR